MTKEIIFCINFKIRRVVKLGVKKDKRLIIWNGLSTMQIHEGYRFFFTPRLLKSKPKVEL